MTVKTSDIGWGTYEAFEGPFFFGSKKVPMATSASPFIEKLMSVMTATEGGSWDAYNAYDVCIATAGALQFCNRTPQRSVDKLIGACVESNQALTMQYLSQIADRVTPAKKFDGWHLSVGGSDLDSIELQKMFWLGGATGLKGQWTPGQMAHAKNVAATVASMLGDDAFIPVQLAFTQPKLIEYATLFGVSDLFAPGYPIDGWEGAIRAIYLSYAANLPAYAARIYAKHKAQLAFMQPDVRCITLAKALAFESGVGIWPARFQKIAPVVEKLFGVSMPDTSADLAKWQQSFPSGDGSIFDAKTAQMELVAEGADLGPQGCDGVFGPKSQLALRVFQTKAGLAPDGILGPMTYAALMAAKAKRISG